MSPRLRRSLGTVPRASALRALAFVALLLLGTSAWARQLAPTDARGGLLCALIGVVAAVLLTLGRRLGGPRRTALVVVVVVGGVVATLLAAGLPVRLLGWRNWDALWDVLGDGLSTLPSLTVPYRGLDEAVRIVLMSGAGLLALLAAAATYGHGPARGEAATAGARVPAALVLGVLYGVPVVERNPEHPLLSGAAFALALALFLGADRLRGRASVGTGVVAALAAVLAGLVITPAINADEPWIDYQDLAGGISEDRAETFSWDHSYGPLNWSRNGRELLRIKAKDPAYWKTVDLDHFDGLRWSYDAPRRPGDLDSEVDVRRTDRFEDIQVTIRDLRTQQIPGAGVTLRVMDVPGGEPVRAGDGTFRTGGRPLRAGDTYRATVYVPREESSDLGTPRPQARVPFDLTPYLSIDLPQSVGGPALPGRYRVAPQVSFAPYDRGGQPTLRVGPAEPSVLGGDGASEALDASAYGRTWRLAQQLRAQSSSPYDYLRRVGRRVRAGATYTESPPPARVPLDSFLFDTRQGYCQQFSGAMALLLRMGGVPARVASGFSPGTFDAKRGEYVVRDLDAHSWVEAYFPGTGWVTFDPTPSESPAASQDESSNFDDSSSSSASDVGPAQPSGARRADSTDSGTVVDLPGADAGGGFPWVPVVGGLAGLSLLGLLGATLLRARRPRPRGEEPWQVAELRRALERTGRPVEASMTLAALARRFAGAPEAQDYVARLQAGRFAGRPLPAGREARGGRLALRRELAHGLGPLGRLRALLALPPRRA